MKVFLTALTLAAATIVANSGWARERDGDAVLPSRSIARLERGPGEFTPPRSNGVAEWSAVNTYGIRCTLTAGPDASEQRRPLRWLLNRCRPWAA